MLQRQLMHKGWPRMSKNCLFEVDDSVPGRVVVHYPAFDTQSELNCFQNWRVRHARHKRQKDLVALYFASSHTKVAPPCKCTLVRQANRFLDDHDNLPSSMKWVVDAIALHLTGDKRPGLADGDKRLTWSYSQEKAKKKGLRIIFEF